jgi:glycosyltransferase involved in cell wall biosynthesis
MSHAHRSGSALNRHPSFSIVIPTYQRRDLVCDAVRAIAATDYAGPVEIVVVVDGSTDGTAGALRQLHGVVPLKIIEQANGGAAQARNCGALQAQYDIILFLDDDMLCEPNLLEEHARMYRLGADAVIGDTPIDPRAPAGFLPESVGRWINAERVRTPLSPFDVFSGQLSIKREVFEQLGGFDTMFTDGGTFSNEDADLGVRLLQQYKVRHNPMAISRQHYIVSVREYMRRAAATAAGDHHFISKHPNLTRELFDMRGRGAILSRCLYLPLSRVPVLPQMLVAVAVWLAEWAARTRFRSNRGIARFFSGARSVAYWSEMRARSAIPDPQPAGPLLPCDR